MQGSRRFIVQSLVMGLLVVSMIGTPVKAGPIAELVGKGLDKVAAGIIKAQEKAKSMKPKGKLLKGAKKKMGKHKGARGGDACGCQTSSCGC